MKVKIKVPESDSYDEDQYVYNGLIGYIDAYCNFDYYEPEDRIFIELTNRSKEKINKFNKENSSQYRLDPGIYVKYLVKISGNIVISNE